MKIDCVRTFMEQARKGLCGNTPFMWTVQEFVEQAELMGERNMGEVFVTSIYADSFRLYHRTCSEVCSMFKHAKKNGGRVINPRRLGSSVLVDDIIVMESPSVDMQIRHTSFLGEYMRNERYLRFAVSNKAWGQCKRSGQDTHADGLCAEQTILKFMGPYAQHLFEVAEAYPNHTIEFTNFPWNMGIWNTRPLIWEVRMY